MINYGNVQGVAQSDELCKWAAEDQQDSFAVTGHSKAKHQRSIGPSNRQSKQNADIPVDEPTRLHLASIS